jgi:serine/threonine-protein kinase
MGVVVAAWHIELEQRVAVKFLLPQFAQDQSAAERFRREARAAVQIRSEHVARVIDVGTLEDGEPYMVMEYLEGKDLQSELERAGCFEISEAVEYVLQACLAMAEAHAKGMVHRDLKPANLFRTTRADGARVIKVLDFGISKSIQGSSDPQLSLTRTAAMIGSPLYMSPEQLESARDVDERADVWSLGVILFELLTGSLPFGGDTLPQLARRTPGAPKERAAGWAEAPLAISNTLLYLTLCGNTLILKYSTTKIHSGGMHGYATTGHGVGVESRAAAGGRTWMGRRPAERTHPDRLGQLPGPGTAP